eukprot:m51a1_g11051 putative dihydroorotate dehydrogenase family protein (376) ;mRNA; f:505802-507010
MSSLEVEVCGLKMRNPLMVAAGPPVRDADAIAACARGGAGCVVAKTISRVAARVPRPCMARPTPQLRDSMINVELWSDMSPDDWIAHEYPKARAALPPGCPLVASVGYNAADMREIVPRVDGLVDAFEFSCHYTSLAEVRELASALRSCTRKPVFAKLSPHGHDLVALARELRSAGVSGFVVMNSLGPCLTLDVEAEPERMAMLGGAKGAGWLSGPAVHPIAVYWVSQLAREFPDVPVIGVGGVTTWRDAAEFIAAGASAVQVCTAAIYKGPGVFAEIAAGLAKWVERRGAKNIAELRGIALPHLPKEHNLVPPMSRVDPQTCTYCGLCAKSCPYEAITVDSKGRAWTVNKDKCYGCGLCTTLCPTRSLSLTSRP